MILSSLTCCSETVSIVTADGRIIVVSVFICLKYIYDIWKDDSKTNSLIFCFDLYL